MNVVKAIGLAGIADFKKSVLKIEPGITYVYGKNQLMGGIGNAAGKTVLGSAAAGIFYETPIIGTKKDKTKSGVRFIEFTRGGKTVKIQQSYTGRSERIKILVDGVEKAGRTPSMTKALLPRYWKISEDEYTTYGHLSSSVPHPLVTGDTAARKKFFTSFFQLDRLDAEKKVLSAYALELKKIRARFAELDATFKAVKGDMLSKVERLELESQVGVLEKRLQVLRAKGDEAQKIRSLLDFEKYSAQQIAAFSKIVNDLEDFDASSMVAKLKKRVVKARALVTQLDDYRAYLAARKKYDEQTKDIDLSTDMETLAERSAKFVRATAELKVYEDLVDPKLLYGPALKSMKQSAEEPSVSKKEMAKLEARLDQMVNHSRKFKGGVCGECGQPVAKHDPDKIDKLKTELEELEASWVQWDRYTEMKAKYEREMEAYGPKAEAREKAQRIQDKYRDDHGLFKKRERIVEPETVEEPEEAEDVDALLRQIEIIEWGDQHLEEIKAVGALTDEQRGIKFDAERIDKAQDTMARARTRLEVHNTVKARASKMRERLQEFEAQLGDEEALAFALEAYADKAIKKMAVEAISEQMMATINKMSSLVFNNYRFEFVWGSSDINLLVHRDKKPPTDVRLLSGAESKLFTLMLVFSLLMFVPSSKRLSLLILDEPCASFHEDMVERLHALFPHMLTLIPSILVLTPRNEERYQGAKEYTVYRDETGACIKKGHPQNV